MLSELPYANFADFKPYATSDVERKSRKICGQVKRPNVGLIEQAIAQFSDPGFAPLQPFLNENVVLVPIPRSSPTVEGGAWPPLTIAELLVKHGFGRRVYPCVERIKALPKSSLQSGAKNRPMVKDHYDTLRVNRELDEPQEITLIDDVVTAGRTSFACAQRLHEAFPNATLRLFSVMRTQSFDSVPKIITFGTGVISFNPASGKTSRNP